MPSSVQNVFSLFAPAGSPSGATAFSIAPPAPQPSALSADSDRESAGGPGTFRDALQRAKPRDEGADGRSGQDSTRETSRTSSKRTDKPTHPAKPRRAEHKKVAGKGARSKPASDAGDTDAAEDPTAADAQESASSHGAEGADADACADGETTDPPRDAASPGVPANHAAAPAPHAVAQSQPQPARRPQATPAKGDLKTEQTEPAGRGDGSARLTARPASASAPAADPAHGGPGAADPEGASTDAAKPQDPQDPSAADPQNSGSAGFVGAQMPGLYLGAHAASANAAGGARANVSPGAGEDNDVAAVSSAGTPGAATSAAAADWDDLAALTADSSDATAPARTDPKDAASPSGRSPFASTLEAAGANGAAGAAAAKAPAHPGAPAGPDATGKGDAAADPTPDARFAQANHARIVTGVRGELLPNGGTMHLRLDPPELGDLQVSVHLRDGVMTAAFHTSNDEATRLLSHSLGDLRSMLEAQGVNVERLHVQQAPRNPNPGDSRDGRDSRHGGRQGPLPEQQQSDRREQQRKQMIQRMWDKLAGKDPVDLVA